MLAALEKLGGRQYVAPLQLAIVHLGLGERDKAFALLEQAVEDRNIDVVGLTTDMLFDPLVGDPRYRDRLRRIGLAGQPGYVRVLSIHMNEH